MYSLFLFLPDMSTSSQTEPLCFKQRDVTGLITLQKARERERERERESVMCEDVSKALSRAGMS